MNRPIIFFQKSDIVFKVKKHNLIDDVILKGKTMYNTEDMKLIQKAFMDILKDAAGKGPKNMYAKLTKNELVFHFEGINTDIEKYFIKEFGQEVIDKLTDYYERDAINTENKLKDILEFDMKHSFYKLDSDFINDKFAYRMIRTD